MQGIYTQHSPKQEIPAACRYLRSLLNSCQFSFIIGKGKAGGRVYYSFCLLLVPQVGRAFLLASWHSSWKISVIKPSCSWREEIEILMVELLNAEKSFLDSLLQGGREGTDIILFPATFCYGFYNRIRIQEQIFIFFLPWLTPVLVNERKWGTWGEKGYVYGCFRLKERILDQEIR